MKYPQSEYLRISTIRLLIADGNKKTLYNMTLMTDNFSIQPLTDAHISAACEIYNHFVINSTATFDLVPLTPSEFRSYVIFNDPRYAVFVAIDRSDNSVVGYSVIGQYKPRKAYDSTVEVSVYVYPDFKRRGLGTKLLVKVEDYAKSQGFHALLAGICTESENSLRLFERLGYKSVAHLEEVGVKFGRFLDIAFLEKII